MAGSITLAVTQVQHACTSRSCPIALAGGLPPGVEHDHHWVSDMHVSVVPSVGDHVSVPRRPKSDAGREPLQLNGRVESVHLSYPDFAGDDILHPVVSIRLTPMPDLRNGLAL